MGDGRREKGSPEGGREKGRRAEGETGRRGEGEKGRRGEGEKGRRRRRPGEGEKGRRGEGPGKGLRRGRKGKNAVLRIPESTIQSITKLSTIH